eukprot:TRINITY_DN56596_c0_g1_i1.p1 TRINITY_DN56596_c0_g1~~TRINITY_DN56596_c0_g1_i1.p1  ORF type:complete len:495 (+),score=132.59 TRINITY_DN56596_c0_g1_i1:75-1487(+)
MSGSRARSPRQTPVYAITVPGPNEDPAPKAYADHVEYCIVLSGDGVESRVWHRYSDFDAVLRKVRQVCPGVPAPPPKAYGDRFAEKLLATRAEQLQLCLRAALQAPQLAAPPAAGLQQSFRQFIGHDAFLTHRKGRLLMRTAAQALLGASEAGLRLKHYRLWQRGAERRSLTRRTEEAEAAASRAKEWVLQLRSAVAVQTQRVRHSMPSAGLPPADPNAAVEWLGDAHAKQQRQLADARRVCDGLVQLAAALGHCGCDWDQALSAVTEEIKRRSQQEERLSAELRRASELQAAAAAAAQPPPGNRRSIKTEGRDSDQDSDVVSNVSTVRVRSSVSRSPTAHETDVHMVASLLRHPVSWEVSRASVECHAQRKDDSGKEATFYGIDCEGSAGSWRTWKRFSQFHDFRAHLASRFTKGIHFPSRSAGKVTGKALEQRKDELAKWMEAIIDRASQGSAGPLRAELLKFLEVPA